MNDDSLPPNNRDRFNMITNHIDNPDTILDIGCVRHSESRREVGNLHEFLSKSYPDSKIVGIDILKEEIYRMKKQGYNVIVADAETMDLDQKFDTIVAGEVIEHLANPGMFLQRAASHLSKNGKIIISTPNPDGFVYWRKALTEDQNNPTHTCWIDVQNLKQITSIIDTDLSVVHSDYVAPQGGISTILWKIGFKRASSPNYVAILQKV